MQTDVSLDDIAEVIERHMAAEPSYVTLDQQSRLPVAQPQQQPHVVILEQPASRALRFLGTSVRAGTRAPSSGSAAPPRTRRTPPSR
ncbi:hypothetical protein MRX96_045425 [Rhipicephalus microplus]